jgi:hypothetical protein
MTRRDAGLMHEALFYEDPQDLARHALPWLRDALFEGDVVTTLLDRAAEVALRAVLGADAERVLFLGPRRRESAQSVLVGTRRLVEDLTRHGGRVVVLEQADAGGVHREAPYWEAAFNLVLTDHPTTLLCAWATGLDRELDVMVRRSHPLLHVEGQVWPSSDYDDPAAIVASYTPPVLVGLGPPDAGVAFTELTDLPRVRRAAADVAARAGLGGERADSFLLAVNEAAKVTLLRAGAGGACRLDLWVGPATLTADVRGPLPYSGRCILRLAGTSDDPPPVGDLWWVHDFSDATQVGNDAGAGVIRVTMERDGA